MKKVELKKISLIVILVLIITTLTGTSNENDNESEITLTSSEAEQLNEIDGALLEEPLVLELKKAGYLNDFIEELKSEYNEMHNDEFRESEAALLSWGLTPDMTVTQLEMLAQDYLNAFYNGITVNSQDFFNLIKEMYYGDSHGLHKKATDNPKFGAFYLYGCIYYMENILEDSRYHDNWASSSRSYSYSLSEQTYAKTLDQIFEDDFSANFRSTHVMRILKDYAKKHQIESGPDDPLDGEKIQEYTR